MLPHTLHPSLRCWEGVPGLLAMERLREYYLTYDAPESVRAAHVNLKRLEATKVQLEKLIPTVMVMEQMEEPRDTFILGRGDYRNHLEKVTAATPATLPPLPPGAPRNRLGLAQWLASSRRIR